MTDIGFKFTVLQAAHGDSILIQGEFDGTLRNILIDGGPAKAYQYKKSKGVLQEALLDIKKNQQRIDLLILSHVDDDHIKGLLLGFKNNGLLAQLTDEVWFNSGSLIDEAFNQPVDTSHVLDFDYERTDSVIDDETSIKQGVDFESFLKEKGIWHRELILAGQVKSRFDIRFVFLSPTRDKLEKLLTKWEKEQPNSLTSHADTDHCYTFDQLLKNDVFDDDLSIHNGSSIAFIFEYNSKRLLFLGDAHNNVIVENIKLLKDDNDNHYNSDNRLKLNYVKLSHHGSQYNTGPDFLKLIECDNFIVSTDASRHGLPNKKTLARIESEFPQANILFNYPNIIKDKIFQPQELQDVRDKGLSLTGCETPINL